MKWTLSRWNLPTPRHFEFLVSSRPRNNNSRFYSGADSHCEGGHTYEFTWNPGKYHGTDAAGGRIIALRIRGCSFRGLERLRQCLPADVGIRMNLLEYVRERPSRWNAW
jgi:hypothetical protein